jgi:hypothetical protein
VAYVLGAAAAAASEEVGGDSEDVEAEETFEEGLNWRGAVSRGAESYGTYNDHVYALLYKL